MKRKGEGKGGRLGLKKIKGVTIEGKCGKRNGKERKDD